MNIILYLKGRFFEQNVGEWNEYADYTFICYVDTWSC